MELFRGYVPTRNKQCLEKFKGVEKLKTRSEVQDLDEYAGILGEETILIDVDDAETSELLFRMVQDLELKCRVYATTRGKHFLFKNCGVKKSWTKCTLAVGITTDGKVGANNSYEILKSGGVERPILYDFPEGEIQELPKWLTPVKSNYDFPNLGEGDGRNQTLFNYILTLQSDDFTKEEARECIRLINRYVLKKPLSDKELDVILRDDAFKKTSFFRDKTFLFDKFATYLKNNNHIVKINNQLHIYKDGIYVSGAGEIEGAMIKLISNLKRAWRSEVLSYLEIMIEENTKATNPNIIAFSNGLYNIRDGSFKEFTPDVVITNKIPWPYNPAAHDDLLDHTLNRLACDDPEVRALLEEMVGFSPQAKRVHLPEVVGKGYGTFWNFKGRYRVCKGSRASKKSKTTALNIIKRMMQYPEANTLVVRKVFRTLKDSCFTELKWAINRLGVSAYWEIKESPLEMTYLPTGQKIYFRGLDDPLKVTSITVEIGYLCWCWIEEAYEIMNEADFDMLDESIRGAIPEETGLFKQITLTFNPWNEKHWIRKRFFGEITGKDAQGNPTYKFHDSWISPDGQIYATTTNYLCNEWLDTADLKVFNTMKENNPRRYKVAGLGGWGIVDGLIFDNWREEAFDYLAISKKPDVKSAFGLDFGYTNDPTALFCGLVSEKERTIWVFDELYEKALTNRAICDRITGMGYGKERIKADCAEPKSIDELRDAGLHRIRAARKGKDSVNNGIQYIQGYTIIVHPRCVNFITEISNYTWAEDKFGAKINVPIDDFNHLMDAMRYGLEDMLVGPAFSFD